MSIEVQVLRSVGMLTLVTFPIPTSVRACTSDQGPHT
jgi:hypothetical protein